MNDDVECPYCGKGQEINQDDGHGCAEDETYEQECGDCGKTFAFTASLHYYYSAHKADCLNGAKHKYKPTSTWPRKYTRMRCTDCDQERQPTEAEMAEILSA